ncbi:hypothetical protein OV079_26725 [Nannocystis pusilla]|uniref:Uncharacterized protein n=1 Tax=Nannocystis pusilla TaxID=889268 RepID=A0A9X3ERP0_9BACT|nr:hypothetical protein [Nannocystis pusilla]MCY1009092.1 hypothetical protein [Nannocystis pusilla]
MHPRHGPPARSRAPHLSLGTPNLEIGARSPQRVNPAHAAPPRLRPPARQRLHRPERPAGAGSGGRARGGARARGRAPEAGDLGAAFEQPGDPRQQIDHLTVWGWSRDGRYFAFETFDAGPGAATCEGAARLFVVDTDSDVLVPDGYVEVRPKSPDAEPCDPPDLRAALAPRRTALLQAHGIEVGHLLAPTEPQGVAAPRPGAKAYAIALPSGQTATATLEVLGGDRERAHEGKGAAFKLDLVRDGQAPLQLEPGVRRRPYVWNTTSTAASCSPAPTARTWPS